MKCPVCGAAELIHDTRDMPYTYKGENTRIKDVSGDFCAKCGDNLIPLLGSPCDKCNFQLIWTR